MQTTEQNDNTFTISVVIPAYNAGKYVARAIDSVLAQTHQPDEIIVVDDGSTDNTAEQIKKYGSKVKYIYQQNAGPGAARNTGIEAATGNWVAFLDGDDEWLDDKLRLQTDLLRRNPHLVWVTANYYRCLCDENRRQPQINPQKAENLLRDRDYFSGFFSAFIHDAYGCTDTMLVNREVLREAGLFHTSQKRAEDMDLWFNIAYRRPEIGYLAEPLAVYHLAVSQSLSRTCKDWGAYRDMISRQIKTATEFGKLDELKPCAALILRRWMRSMLFENRKQDIRGMMAQFDEFLPGWYKLLMRLLTVFPKITAVGCHMISKMVRALRLRRKLVRRPK